MDKFQNKYRISSHRYWGWDYAGPGTYFITLIIQDHKCLLGEISNQKMKLSKFGRIISDEWINSFEIRNELFLDEFVIMPNHLHGLVHLKDIEDCGNVEVETNGRSTLPPAKPDHIYYHQNKPKLPIFQRKPKSISSFVAGYKSATVNKIDNHIDLIGLDVPKYNSNNKLWQSNYYDHIIRNEKEYWIIKNYIKNNPVNWKSDKFYGI